MFEIPNPTAACDDTHLVPLPDPVSDVRLFLNLIVVLSRSPG